LAHLVKEVYAIERIRGLADAARARLRAKPVVLVDDVFTTGATVHAATTALLEADVLQVNVLTFSRVLIS